MHHLSKSRNFAIMLIPSVAVYTLYIVISVFVAIYYSFTKYSGVGVEKWVGLKNYKRLLTDRYFIIALSNTGIILVVALITLVVLGFLLANLLHQKLKIKGVCQALIYIPIVIAPIVVGVIWLFILDPSYGFINNFLRYIGLGDYSRSWIGAKNNLAAYSIAFIYFWRNLGYIATIFLTGINMISDEIYEAAGIDGVNWFTKMIYITIPMLKETITIVIVLVVTGVFKVLEIVTQLTNGGPNHLSETLVTYSYTVSFNTGEYGYGMSIATVTFMISLVFSLFYINVINKKGK